MEHFCYHQVSTLLEGWYCTTMTRIYNLGPKIKEIWNLFLFEIWKIWYKTPIKVSSWIQNVIQVKSFMYLNQIFVNLEGKKCLIIFWRNLEISAIVESEKKVVKVKQVKAQIHTVDCNHADRNDFYRNRKYHHENFNTKSPL